MSSLAYMHVIPLRRPLEIERCTDQLWEGVACTLHAGHSGSHERRPTNGSVALSWRSAPAPTSIQPTL
jgi:hypothetical protein